ncbi:MAG: hypothetical protein Q4E17_06720 [Synergistes sp.]|nr:hypothetical protein [Synergistes sp.]
MSFAKTIRPGWRADILAKPCIALIKALGIRKDVAVSNIARCLPDTSEEERRKILSESYDNMIWTAVEMMCWQKDPSLIDTMTKKIVGREYFDNALAAGRGVIIVSPHIGSWEHGAAWFGRHSKFHGIVRHSDSPFQRALIEKMRVTSGLMTMSKDAPMKRVITALKKNEAIGILSDQHGGGEGIPAPFFGTMTSTSAGPAVFSLLSGAPILPVYSRHIEPFAMELKIFPPLAMPPKDMPHKEAIAALTADVNRLYETMIRETPGQWLWQHRRFK